MAEHFEVVQLQSSSRSSSAQTYNDCYHAAQQLFVVQSYGYYTEMFLTKISEEACRMFDFMLKHQLKKLLREIVLKFMMSDLELVFLSHFCRRDRWNIRSKLIENHSHIFKQHSGVEQDEDHRRLLLFIYLHSYNVKMYLGDKQTVAVLKNYLAVELDQWDTLYNLWLKECPVNTFNISPREINAIYNGYSKDCQVMEHKKNYNSIVDKILELSSTYTMMPASKKKLQKGEAGRKMVKLDSGIDEKNHSSSLRLSSKRS